MRSPSGGPLSLSLSPPRGASGPEATLRSQRPTLAGWFSFLLFVLSGCTFEPGTHFATVSATLQASFVMLPDRALADGWQRLASDYEIRIQRAAVELGDVRLFQAGGAALGFDPARPPPGYTLCHGGHCHSVDGRLVPYDEITAALTGGGGPRAVLTLAGAGTVDLLAATERPLACEPDCHLPAGKVTRARAIIGGLVIEGQVRDGRSPSRLPAEAPFRWATAAMTAPLTEVAGPLDLPVDNRHPPEVSLRLSLTLTGRLFDDVNFAGLPASPDGTVDLAATGAEPARRQILEALTAATLETAVTRSAPSDIPQKGDPK
jgi:hypothetical protein